MAHTMRRYPTEFQQKTLWNAMTGVALVVLGSLVVGLIWLMGQVLGFLQPVLIPLIVAGIIAYVLDPVVRFLEKRGLRRLWAVITLFALILTIAALLTAAVVPAVQRAQDALSSPLKAPKAPASQIPTATAQPEDHPKKLGSALLNALNNLRDHHRDGPIGWLLTAPNDAGEATPSQPKTLEYFAQSHAGQWLADSQGAILKTTQTWLSAGSTKLLGFLGLTLGLILVPVYLFFFLKDSASIRREWHHYVPLKASQFKTGLVETLQEINGYLVSFFRGQVLVAIIDGVLVGIALTLFGLPYGLLIGVFMAILGIIPYIGNILCLIPACIIAYLHAQADAPFDMQPWTYVACVVGIFVVVQQINSLITAPKIVGDSVGLHPLTVIFSMLFWSLILGGFVGALLAVPMTAAVKVLFRRFIWNKQQRELAGVSSEI
jgi:predicted PurR-regulated permease PerM